MYRRRCRSSSRLAASTSSYAFWRNACARRGAARSYEQDANSCYHFATQFGSTSQYQLARRVCIIIRHMIGLTDTQLKIVMNAARLVPVEKRDTFLGASPPCSHCADADASPTPMLLTWRNWRCAV
jgi:hypothetical protein